MYDSDAAMAVAWSYFVHVESPSPLTEPRALREGYLDQLRGFSDQL